MSHAVELLLTLFAMLSAVTGAFSGVPEGEARMHQAESQTAARATIAVAQEAVQPITTIIPSNALPSTGVPALRLFAIAAAIPLYADRRIE